MAISQMYLEQLFALNKRGLLPCNPDILEIGEANFYGDCILADYGIKADTQDLRALALAIYAELFGEYRVKSLDMAAARKEDRVDLNTWDGFDEGTKFDVIFNHGTLEHVFLGNAVFRPIHNHCKLGGLMFHEAPWLGWPNHGFENSQPGKWWDIARANCYRIELIAGIDIKGKSAIRFYNRVEPLRMLRDGKLPANLNLLVVYRKVFDVPFSIPTQGVYTSVSQEEEELWLTQR